MLKTENLWGSLRSRTLLQVALLSLLAGVYSLLAVWKEHSFLETLGDIPAQLHTVFSLALGYLLVFRTKACYDRWWEARIHWGGLVNASRNLAAKINVLVDIPKDQVEEAGRTIIAFAYALRDHLRDEPPKDLPEDMRQEAKGVQHFPGFLTNRMYQLVGRWKKEGWIDGDDERVIDRDLAKLLDICGSCERILKTPFVRSFSAFTRQAVWVFVLTLPWGIVDSFQDWTVPITILMAYFMIGLELVSEHIENPFDRDEDDLDLEALSAAIDQSVSEMLRFPHK